MKTDYRNHPNNPSNQPFNVRGNHTKKNGWWRNGTANKEIKGEK